MYIGVADEDGAWEKTLLKFMQYMEVAKKPHQSWRRVLNNHFNQRRELGGPIIPSIRDCHTMAPVLEGGFEATLNTQNSLSVGDGLELSVSAFGDNEDDALNNVCHKALALLLLTDASKVLLQPKQWCIDGDDIVDVAVLLKYMYVQTWARPAIGDCRMGDEQPRLQPPPSRARPVDSNYEPPRGPEEQHQRDQMITRLLNAEIAAHRVAWPFQLHRGRWRILDKFLPPRVGALMEWVQARPDQFTIIRDDRQRWGIIRT